MVNCAISTHHESGMLMMFRVTASSSNVPIITKIKYIARRPNFSDAKSTYFT